MPLAARKISEHKNTPCLSGCVRWPSECNTACLSDHMNINEHDPHNRNLASQQLLQYSHKLVACSIALPYSICQVTEAPVQCKGQTQTSNPLLMTHGVLAGSHRFHTHVQAPAGVCCARAPCSLASLACPTASTVAACSSKHPSPNDVLIFAAAASTPCQLCCQLSAAPSCQWCVQAAAHVGLARPCLHCTCSWACALRSPSGSDARVCSARRWVSGCCLWRCRRLWVGPAHFPRA